MARWLALCPRPNKGRSVSSAPNSKIACEEIPPFCKHKQGFSYEIWIEINEIWWQTKVEPGANWIINHACRTRTRLFIIFCVRVVLFWFFNETTARMESGFSMVTNQSDRYVGTYTSSWSLLQLRATDFATIWFNTLFMALHFAIIS